MFRMRIGRCSPRAARLLCFLGFLLIAASSQNSAQRGTTALTEVETISDETTYSKYPSLAVDRDGVRWLAWTRTDEGLDQVVVRQKSRGGWTEVERLDRGQGVEGSPSIVIGQDGRPRVFWHGRRQDRWAVYTRRHTGDGWGEERQLSDPSLQALHPAVVQAADGHLWLSWEIVKPGGFAIQAVREREPDWSEPLMIESPGSDRRPALAACPNGDVFLAWDSTKSGNFDVWIARLRPSPGGARAEPAEPVTQHASIDDSPSLACDGRNRLWLAWNGMRGHQKEPLATDRHSGDAFLRLHENGRWLEPPGVAPSALPGQVSWGMVNKTPRDAVDPYWHWKQTQNYPIVSVDGEDRAWVIWRTDATGAHNFDLWARVFDSQRWSPLLKLTTFSPGRDEWPAVAPAPDGSLYLAWEGQVLPRPGREQETSGGDVDFYNTRANPNVVLAGRLQAPAEGWVEAPLAPVREGPPDPAHLVAPLPGPPPGGVPAADGSWKIFFGDPHSHSILSDAKTGLPDQLLSLARDRLGLDFAVVSDHSEMGLLQPAEYGEIQLAAGAFSEPGRFISLSGWEWTSGTRYGHRVIIHPDDRGTPLSSDLAAGDTIEELYQHVRRYGGVMSPHHTGQATWGRWNPDAHHDEELEPNFEIASWHGRFEFYGNPWEGRRQVPGHHYQDVLRRGRHVGVMAASDTHHLNPGEGGLTAVLASSLDRQSLFDAIRNRRNYATTGARIILDFQVNGHPMGSIISADGAVEMKVRVEGTTSVDRVEVVRDLIDTFAAVRVEQDPESSEGVFLIYEPHDGQGGRRLPILDTRRLSFTVRDLDPPQGETHYYLRVTQTDGHQAWSSPVWVKR